MKYLFIGLLALVNFSAFGDTYNNVICASGRSFIQPSDMFGCQSAEKCALENLQKNIRSIPEQGLAGYSEVLKQYVQVKMKKVSDFRSVPTTIIKSNLPSCLDGYGSIFKDYYGSCYISNACVTISLEYDKCTKKSYDPQNGDLLMTCPNGQIIRH